MFGRNRAKRQKKKLKKERKAFEKEKSQFERRTEEPQGMDAVHNEAELEKNISDRERHDEAARKKGKEYGQEVISRDVQGLTPKQRSAMQYEANKQIQRSHQSANRRLLGEQGRHGIVGKGGVGYAQQRDLQRMANEERGQATRDLHKADAEQRLKNLAASFAVEQGEMSRSKLNRQLAQDELEHRDEKKRQRKYEDRFSKTFSRV